jgi:hypothetical protein
VKEGDRGVRVEQTARDEAAHEARAAENQYLHSPSPSGLVSSLTAGGRPFVPPAFIARFPPSTGRSTPVTIDAASDTRKITGPTISRGSPSRFSGMPERNFSRIAPSDGSSRRWRRPGVRN